LDDALLSCSTARMDFLSASLEKCREYQNVFLLDLLLAKMCFFFDPT